MSESNGTSDGILESFLFGVFLTLKLTKTVDWSWWWITAPLWISIGGYYVVIGAVLLWEFIETPLTNLVVSWKRKS